MNILSRLRAWLLSLVESPQDHNDRTAGRLYRESNGGIRRVSTFTVGSSDHYRFDLGKGMTTDDIRRAFGQPVPYDWSQYDMLTDPCGLEVKQFTPGNTAEVMRDYFKDETGWPPHSMEEGLIESARLCDEQVEVKP